VDDGGAVRGLDGQVIQVVTWWTRTAWVLPVLTLVATTLSLGLRLAMGMAAPEASTTSVPAANDSLPLVAAGSMRPLLSSAAMTHRNDETRTL
jgi:hypothetical protein